MAHKHSSNDKHKKKHKKEKKRHKEKKEKKNYKSKARISSSSSSASEENQEFQKQEWNFLDAALSHSNTSVRDQQTDKVKENRGALYDPKTSDRELNPYWKNSGNGLPTTLSSSNLKNAGFLKPGEGSGVYNKRENNQYNWRKNASSFSEAVTVVENDHQCNQTDHNLSNENLTDEELNSLAGKLVKAEILGNKSLVEKLKSQLDAARKARVGSKENSSKNREEVVLYENNLHSIKKSWSKDYNIKSKRPKLSHGKDSVGSLDDNSLKNLFVKEKSETEEIFVPSSLHGTNASDFDDTYLDIAATEKFQQKKEKLKEKRKLQEALNKHKTLDGCSWCLDNRNQTKHLIVSTGHKCYLCLPQELSLATGHCIIVPINHESSGRNLDEDVWHELKTYQRQLSKMFSEEGKDVVFFEDARAFKYFPHCYIQCVPFSKEVADLAPIYFQKAIQDSETEWSCNKKLIDFRKKDFRKSIPKDLPYFAVTFGTEGGFAHVIEDEKLFPRNFAQEIIGNMLDLEPGRWRKPSKESFNVQREKALAFLQKWKKYEFNENSYDSESSSESI